jgi:hypothetical protein
VPGRLRAAPVLFLAACLWQTVLLVYDLLGSERAICALAMVVVYLTCKESHVGGMSHGMARTGFNPQAAKIR